MHGAHFIDTFLSGANKPRAIGRMYIFRTTQVERWWSMLKYCLETGYVCPWCLHCTHCDSVSRTKQMDKHRKWGHCSGCL